MNRTASRRLLTRTAFVLGLAFGAQPATAAETWNFYEYYPAVNASVKRLQQMVEDINRAAGPDLNIRMHLGGSLQIDAANVTGAVADNVVQMGDDSFFTGNIPIAGALRLPFLINGYDEFAKAQTVIDPIIEAEYKKKGIVVLGRYHYPPQTIWSRKKLTSLADIKGQKLRVLSPEQSEFIRHFGGSSVTIGTAAVAPALERGVVDGVLTASAGGGVLWKDLLKYNYRIVVNFADNVLIANAEAFEKLSPDTRAKVRKIVAEAAPAVTKALRDDEDEQTKKMIAAGIIVTQPTPEDIAKAQAELTSYWDSWGKSRGPETAEVIVRLRKTLGR
jgi:TRAP-type C4-dicarboxylate transport system substrate-binding protein